jgi:hypothetical protein
VLTYPFTLCSLVLTKLLVLNRLAEFAKLKVAIFGRALIALILLGNAVGFCGNIALVVYASRAITVLDDLSATGNVTHSGTDCSPRESIAKFKAQATLFSRAASVHYALETLMLLVVVIAFVFVGTSSARRIRAAMNMRKLTQANSMTTLNVDVSSPARQSLTRKSSFNRSMSVSVSDDRASTSASQLQRQIVGTCSVVFVAFVLRASYTIAFGLASGLQNHGDLCSVDDISSRCRICDNVYALMQVTMMHTPEILFAITLIAQPLALIVVLWGMTSGQTLDVMRTAEAERRRQNDEASAA